MVAEVYFIQYSAMKLGVSYKELLDYSSLQQEEPEPPNEEEASSKDSDRYVCFVSH